MNSYMLPVRSDNLMTCTGCGNTLHRLYYLPDRNIKVCKQCMERYPGYQMPPELMVIGKEAMDTVRGTIGDQVRAVWYLFGDV